MDRTIDREFRAFHQSGFSREMLEKSWQKGKAKRPNIQRFQVINSKVYGQEGIRPLQRIVQKYPLPDEISFTTTPSAFAPPFSRTKISNTAPPSLSRQDIIHSITPSFFAILFTTSMMNARDGII